MDLQPVCRGVEREADRGEEGQGAESGRDRVFKEDVSLVSGIEEAMLTYL